ncbi:MAG: hypothetical protein ACJ71A_02170, partial [Nitrososphaeraceae archaeon]
MIIEVVVSATIMTTVVIIMKKFGWRQVIEIIFDRNDTLWMKSQSEIFLSRISPGCYCYSDYYFS